jgi:hypothetical protein
MLRYLKPRFWKNAWNIRKVSKGLDIERAKKIEKMELMWKEMEDKTEKSTMFLFKVKHLMFLMQNEQFFILFIYFSILFYFSFYKKDIG